jgi:hypothetical protein
LKPEVGNWSGQAEPASEMEGTLDKVLDDAPPTAKELLEDAVEAFIRLASSAGAEGVAGDDQ